LTKGFLKNKNGNTTPSSRAAQAQKADDKKKKILDLADLMPESKQPYYLFMPDEEERKLY